MFILEKKFAFIAKYICRLHGGSQPLLVQASDGQMYVAKFRDNLQGPNLPFNESIGSELYCCCNLPVPLWKPLRVTDAFLDGNPASWFETPEGRRRPESGLCFGSRFLGGEGSRLLEILPRTSFKRVRTHEKFWLAWLVDICACHADNRQALFLEDSQGWLNPFFVDHGHMFGGPNGGVGKQFQSSRYLDSRIYESVSSQYLVNLVNIAAAIPADNLWREAMALPDEWKSGTALKGLADCLERLSTPRLLRNILETMVDAHRRTNGFESSETQTGRGFPPVVLRPGVQAGWLGQRNLAHYADHPACA